MGFTDKRRLALVPRFAAQRSRNAGGRRWFRRENDVSRRLPPLSPWRTAVADRSTDLEASRGRFLNDLAHVQPELGGHEEFLRYWQAVDAEAKFVDDLGQLDTWVRSLAHDRDRLESLRNRVEGATQDPSAAMILQVLLRILSVLDGVGRRLRQRHDERRGLLAAILWRGGPGTRKIKPEEIQSEQQKADGEKKDESKETAAALKHEGPKVPAAVLAKPPQVKPEATKKMER